VVDVLSKLVVLLITVHNDILGFNYPKELYAEDVNFQEI
jgi:hypothetical protein